MRRTILAAAVMFAVTGFASTTDAHDVGLRHTAQHRYNTCKRKLPHRGRACGRNIVKDGWKQKGRPARPATLKEVAAWSRRLRVLAHPIPYLLPHGVPPRHPAGTGVATSQPTAGPQLAAIAACESGGNPAAVSADGKYRGKYQFDYGTWASVGGSGDPAAAPEAEQDARAAALLARRGTRPWPVCG